MFVCALRFHSGKTFVKVKGIVVYDIKKTANWVFFDFNVSYSSG